MCLSLITGADDRGGAYPCSLVLPLFAALIAVALVPAAAQESGSAVGRLSGLFDLNAPMPGTAEYQLAQRRERLRAALTGMDGVSEAFVIIGPGTDGETTITIRVRLAESAAAWSPRMSQAVTALISRLEPSVPADNLLVIDSSGRVLVPAGDLPVAAEAPDGPPPGQSDYHLVPVIVGAVLGLLVIAVAAWYLFAPGRRAAPTAAAETDPWEFLAQARADDLRAVFSQRRPEVLGAVLAAAQIRTAARIMRKLGAAAQRPAPPAGSMHPEVAALVRTDLLEALAAVGREQ
jgi:hypothetical protein